MGTVNCLYCGKKTPDTSAACMHCGAPSHAPNARGGNAQKKFIWFFIAVVVVSLIAVFLLPR